MSLIALAGMSVGLARLPAGGVSFAEGIELVLLLTLVAGIASQARRVVQATPPGRWISGHLAFARRRPEAGPPETPRIAPLDAVPAGMLAARHPAPAPRRLGHARRFWVFLTGTGLLFLVLALALVGFVALLAGLAWAAWAGGITDPGVLLGAPFTALGGVATWQLFAGASRSAYRGRPLYLAIRAFRDSVRVWSSGSLFARVALTSGATASVASATLVPAVLSKPYDYTVFVHDRATGAMFQVDIESGESSQFGEGRLATAPQALMTAPKPFRVGAASFPRGTMLAVLSSPDSQLQGVIALRPDARRSETVSRIEPALPAAYFAVTPGGIVAANPLDGGYWRIDHESGTATRVTSLAVPAGPLAWNPADSVLAMVSGGTVHLLDAETGTVRKSFPLGLPAGTSACGIAAGPKGTWVVTTGDSATMYLFARDGAALRAVEPTNNAPVEACAVTVAPRRDRGGLAVDDGLAEAPTPAP